MNTNEQIEALAKLDGFKFALINFFRDRVFHGSGTTFGQVRMFSEDGTNDFPKYLESYDSIIPLIQKSFSSDNFKKFDKSLGRIDDFTVFELCAFNTINKTPSQLAEALLRATDNWKD